MWAIIFLLQRARLSGNAPLSRKFHGSTVATSAGFVSFNYALRLCAPIVLHCAQWRDNFVELQRLLCGLTFGLLQKESCGGIRRCRACQGLPSPGSFCDKHSSNWRDIFVSCLVSNKTLRLQTLFPLESWLVSVNDACTTVIHEHSHCCGSKWVWAWGRSKAEMVPRDRLGLSPRGTGSWISTVGSFTICTKKSRLWRWNRGKWSILFFYHWHGALKWTLFL